MRWWRGLVLAVLAASPAAADEKADAERDRRVAEFSEQHQLSRSPLYGALKEKGYLRGAAVQEGTPPSLSFHATVEGRPAQLLYVPALDGPPRTAEGMFLVPEERDASPRRLEPRDEPGGFDHALGGAVSRARRAQPERGDGTDLQRFADETRADPHMRDAVAAALGGTRTPQTVAAGTPVRTPDTPRRFTREEAGADGVKRWVSYEAGRDPKTGAATERPYAVLLSPGQGAAGWYHLPQGRALLADELPGAVRQVQLQAHVAATEAEIARKRDLSAYGWSRTPQVAGFIAGQLASVAPGPLARADIARAAGFTPPGAMPQAAATGRPTLVLHFSDEAEAGRAQAALREHEAAVRRALAGDVQRTVTGSGSLIDFGRNLLRTGSELAGARERAPQAVVAVIDASPGLTAGVRQANAGIADMPRIGAGVGAAEDGRTVRAERVWDTRIRGRIAHNKVAGGIDLGDASARFAAERQNVIRHAGETAELRILEAQNRMRGAFNDAGISRQDYRTAASPDEAAAVGRTLGGRGAFLQYRTSDGGSYFLPLTPAAALFQGRTGFADVAARADTAISGLARSGALTRGAALEAWTTEISRTWNLPRPEAARLAASLHGS